MIIVGRRWSILFCLIAAGVCALPGCDNAGQFTFLGYTTQPPFDTGIRSVYVPIAANFSFQKDLEFDLTRQVIFELSRRRHPRVCSERARADSELTMKIVNVKKNTIIFNQLGETRDSELTVQIEVVWRDLRPGHLGDILSNKKRYDPQLKPLPGEIVPSPPKEVPYVITPTADFSPELGGSYLTAQRQAVLRGAVQVVNMMEIWPRAER